MGNILGSYYEQLMSLFERKFELGVMKAIGTKPSQLFQIVFFSEMIIWCLHNNNTLLNICLFWFLYHLTFFSPY